MKNKELCILISLVIVALAPNLTWAASVTAADPMFKDLYDFATGMANGYFARGVAITGGLIGLVMAATMGKVMPALVGVPLGVVGYLGPSIVDKMYASALI